MMFRTNGKSLQSAVPPVSALQQAISSFHINGNEALDEHQLSLALQVAHNLRFQHGWKQVCVHTAASSADDGDRELPRPLLSGLPPQRLYVHPDEQLSLLQKQKAEGKKGMPELQSEREWVLPTQLREKWSLRRFAEVFDAITVVPSSHAAQTPFPDDEDDGVGIGAHNGTDTENEWRTVKAPKRLLLATVDDDSTVVYYIVHDGMVKPRQN